MNYWPGTKIPKSHGNAFDWKSGKSKITQQLDFKSANNAQKYMMNQSESRYFTTYSKAKPSK